MVNEVIMAITALGVASISGGFSFMISRRAASNTRVDSLEVRFEECEKRCSKYRDEHGAALVQIKALGDELDNSEQRRFRLMSRLESIDRQK